MKAKAYCTTILIKKLFASIGWKEQIMYAMYLSIIEYVRWNTF